jgi:hypothetical protein
MIRRTSSVNTTSRALTAYRPAWPCLLFGVGGDIDFRSMSDLMAKGDKWLGKAGIAVEDRNYLDTLAAIRNMVVHVSDSAANAYKRALSKVYGLRSVPSPGEFLDSLDRRTRTPNCNQRRLNGLIASVKKVIAMT